MMATETASTLKVETGVVEKEGEKEVEKEVEAGVVEKRKSEANRYQVYCTAVLKQRLQHLHLRVFFFFKKARSHNRLQCVSDLSYQVAGSAKSDLYCL